MMQAVRNGGAQATPTPAPTLVDYIIKMGSSVNGPTAPATQNLNAGDSYPATVRGGLTFGLPAGGGTDSTSGGLSGGNGRFGSALNLGAGSVVRVLLPDGVFDVEAGFGINFGSVTPGISILNVSNSAVLHAMSAGTTADVPLDITGVQRVMANWDATRATVSITVSGGSGISFTRGAGSSFFCNYMRLRQTA
jgi:hypothetical protein